MSIELPEAQILSRQMNTELVGKQVLTCQLQNYQNFQRLGFINKDISAFNHLSGCRVNSVTSRGNVILAKFNNDMNLVLAPEYGGKVLYNKNESSVPARFHLKLGFTDDMALTVTLTGMGVIQALKDEELESSYVYTRDFSQVPSPLEDKFTLKEFSDNLSNKNLNIKSSLVGKDAVIVGLSNNSFQDIIYRAKIHPKRKAADLNESEKHALYNAIRLVVQERMRANGKKQFIDLYGKQGSYEATMGPNMKDKTCTACGTKVEKLSLGGGTVYFCPECQT